MITAVHAGLLERAQAGDNAAFGELIAPYRRELQVHCYRMLGSGKSRELGTSVNTFSTFDEINVRLQEIAAGAGVVAEVYLAAPPARSNAGMACA